MGQLGAVSVIHQSSGAMGVGADGQLDAHILGLEHHGQVTRIEKQGIGALPGSNTFDPVTASDP